MKLIIICIGILVLLTSCGEYKNLTKIGRIGVQEVIEIDTVAIKHIIKSAIKEYEADKARQEKMVQIKKQKAEKVEKEGK